MNLPLLAIGLVSLGMAVHQARAAYGLNDADGWPFCKAEASKAAKLAYAAWGLALSIFAFVLALIG